MKLPLIVIFSSYFAVWINMLQTRNLFENYFYIQHNDAVAYIWKFK